MEEKLIEYIGSSSHEQLRSEIRNGEWEGDYY